MAAPKKNTFYKLCDKPGRDRIFSTPTVLWESTQEYFKWVSENPWLRVDFRGKNCKRVEIPNERPYTIRGLCTFLGINVHYFSHFKQSISEKIDPKSPDYDPISEDFSNVILYIEQIIYTQKFEGAAVGAFNAILISAELGYIKKLEHSGTVAHTITGMEII